MLWVPKLTIDGRELSPASHRGVTMDYASIDGVPKPRRDGNWTMRMPKRGRIPSRMFAVTISGGYVSQPLSLVVGDIVTIGCSVPLTERGFVAEADLRRPAVAGSVFHFDDRGWPIIDPAAQATAFETRWCPILRMMVIDFGWTGTDVSASGNWNYDLEELESPE